MIETEKSVITALENSLSEIVGNKVFRWSVPSEYADDYPYIRVSELNNIDSDYRDNKATSGNVDIQIDFWTLNEPETIQNEINETMESLGYARTLVTPVFDEDTRALRKAMRYRIKKILKEDL